jgi:hypothetical protein
MRVCPFNKEIVIQPVVYLLSRYWAVQYYPPVFSVSLKNHSGTVGYQCKYLLEKSIARLVVRAAVVYARSHLDEELPFIVKKRRAQVYQSPFACRLQRNV